jgi:hypothetical protein
MTDPGLPSEARINDKGSTGGAGWRLIVGWVLAVAGAIVAFVGGFILLAGKDQFVGMGGDLSWRVGDIDPLLAVGLLAGGVIVAVLGLGLVVLTLRAPRPPVRDKALRDLQLHATAFVLVNAFLWVQDVVIGGGVEYAYWVTIPWGIGLTAHILAYYTGRRRQRPGAPLSH